MPKPPAPALRAALLLTLSLVCGAAVAQPATTATEAPAAAPAAETSATTAPPTEAAPDPDLPPRSEEPVIDTDLPPRSSEGAGAGDADDAPWLKTSMQGWIDSRTTGGYARVTRLLPADDTPHLSNLTEANLQLKLDLRERARIYGDVSWVFARGGFYVGDDGFGQRKDLANHDVASVRPGAFVSELYALLRIDDHWNVTLGKKRVVWGPGLAWNPTDLFNPPKDPTDPTQQRSGSWLARVEGQYDRFSLSLIGAGKTTRQYGGIPSGLVWYPDTMPPLAVDSSGQPIPDGRDDDAHYVLGARIYALVADTDLQLFAFWSHLYNDAFRNKPRFGGAFSRVLGESFEVHAELLGQTGSSRTTFDPACTADLTAALGCAMAGKAVAATSRLDDGKLRWKGLLGLRYQFGEAASASAEYFFNTEGYSQSEFDAFAGALQLRKTALRQGLPIPAGAFGGLGATSSDPGTPQKFAFEPMRRHYLFLTYMHPQLADDFTISTVVILGLEDLSGQLAPQLLWSARQWLNLSVGAFITLPGASSLGAQTATGGVTEYTFQPSLWRAFVAARAFF